LSNVNLSRLFQQPLTPAPSSQLLLQLSSSIQQPQQVPQTPAVQLSLRDGLAWRLTAKSVELWNSLLHTISYLLPAAVIVR
jgi:hypothetical protein